MFYCKDGVIGHSRRLQSEAAGKQQKTTYSVSCIIKMEDSITMDFLASKRRKETVVLPGGPVAPLCPLIPFPGEPLSPFSPGKPL